MQNTVNIFEMLYQNIVPICLVGTAGIATYFGLSYLVQSETIEKLHKKIEKQTQIIEEKTQILDEQKKILDTINIKNDIPQSIIETPITEVSTGHVSLLNLVDNAVTSFGDNVRNAIQNNRLLYVENGDNAQSIINYFIRNSNEQQATYILNCLQLNMGATIDVLMQYWPMMYYILYMFCVVGVLMLQQVFKAMPYISELIKRTFIYRDIQIRRKENLDLTEKYKNKKINNINDLKRVVKEVISSLIEKMGMLL